MSSDSDEYPPDLKVVRREEWGAKPPNILEDEPLRPLKKPIENVFFNDTASYMCDNLEECKPLLQKLQFNNQDGGWPDITHNFMVGTDGTIYEGRGWKYEPDAMYDFLEGNVIDIAYIGTFEIIYPHPKMFEAVENLIKHAIEKKRVIPKYQVTWFRDAV